MGRAPGGRVGVAVDQRQHPFTLGEQLRIHLLGARNAALRELVLELPPPIVASALGYSAQVTEKHAEDAGRTWVTYASYRSARGSIGSEPDTIQQ